MTAPAPVERLDRYSHAVIGDGVTVINNHPSLWNFEGARPDVTAGDIFAWCEKRRFQFLWITPGSEIFDCIKARGAEFLKADGWEFSPRDELKNMVTGWRAGFKCSVIMPGIFDSQGIFEEDTDPLQIWRSVARLTDLLGVAPTVAINTARRLCFQTLRVRLQDEGQDFAPFLNETESTLQFTRPPTQAERSRKFLHLYDKNQMFLSAIGAADLGFGGYVNSYQKGMDVSLFRDMPGLWRASVKLDGAQLLGALVKPGKGWYYTPTLALLSGYGAKIKIHECYLYKQQDRLLEPFYKRVRRALDGCERGTPERDAVKAIYTRFVGWLGRDLRNLSRDVLYRPDWRGTIIALANANQLRNCLKVSRLGSSLPLLISHDAVAFLCDEEDAGRALPHPFTGEGAQYRHQFTLPARAALNDFDKGETAAGIYLKWKARAKK